MRIKLRRTAFALLVCALVNTAVMAGARTKTVTFREDVTVGDTLVKRGSYKVAFDDQAKELQIMRGNKVIARATASLEGGKNVGNYELSYTTLKAEQGVALLLTVDLGGKQAVVSSDRIATARASLSAGQ